MNKVINNQLLKASLSIALFLISVICFCQTYPIVGTGVSEYYDNNTIIFEPEEGQSFYGQDAHYPGNLPAYTDNLDGTITDNVTGLMWEKDMGNKISYDAAFNKAANSSLGGFSDWRVPTIKELYSLALFTGRCFGDKAVVKFIDTIYFNQPIGNTSIGEREIDAQTWSSTQYAGLIMRGDTGIFGYNFVDGRLKAYPQVKPGSGAPNTFYFRMVRGNTSYGVNNFIDNGDGTISDLATGLMWQKSDDGHTRNWETALSYCENLTLGGHGDWRLPNAKELHSIIDYRRCPDVTNSPAIDQIFICSSFENPNGDPNYGYYWTSSPLQDGPSPYTSAAYISFGEAQGQMSFPPQNIPTIYDTHGAGAQRSDPKEESAGSYPTFHGPQGDIQYVLNYARAVRNITSTTSIDDLEKPDFHIFPNPVQNQIVISSDYLYKTVIVYDAMGKIALEFTADSGSDTIDISSLTAGTYFVRVLFSDKFTGTRILLISK